MPDNKTHSSSTPGILAKLRKIFGLNIGTVMFGAILIYMIFSVILYLTASHMESYQVPSGPLEKLCILLRISVSSIMTAEDLRYVNMSGKDKMNDKGKAKYSL